MFVQLVIEAMTTWPWSTWCSAPSSETVTGLLADDKTAFDAVAACFTAGTLTGAPKVRAMELIESLEPTRRGLYGGVVGYLDFAGDADTAIAIRTALMRDGVAYVQAGAGVVADSDPDYEDNETLNKARTVLSAMCCSNSPDRVKRTAASITVRGAGKVRSEIQPILLKICQSTTSRAGTSQDRRK